MAHFRNVVADSMSIDAMSVAIDENRAALRFLARLLPSEIAKGLIEASCDELTSTAKLAEPFLPINAAKKIYRDGSDFYAIYAEIIMDKRESPYKAMWTPGVHFVFYYDPARGLKVDPKGALTNLTKRNTAELIRYLGGLWYFDLWCRDPKAPLTQCSRSITTAPGVKLFTNIEDLGEKWPASEVMKGGNSKWLNLDYRLRSQNESVTPGGWAHFEFEILDGSTGQRAEDVSWDNYRIEAVDGYAPHRRFRVENGIGQFKVMALGLESGESLRVKVANKFQTSLAECTLQVRECA